MAFDFPSSPTVGATYNAGGISYVWDGIAWNAAGAPPAKTAETRNRIVNPAMQISQEFGDAGISASGAYPCDQWVLGFGGVTGSSVRASTGQTPSGNKNQLSCGAAQKASLAASDYLQLGNYVEGLNVVDFRYGFSTAKQAVLRFAIYAPAGTYCVAIQNAAVDRSGIFEYVIAAGEANRWVVKQIVISGDTIGTWLNTNAIGLRISFCFATGTTYQGIAGWQAGNKIATANQVNMIAAGTANAYISDVGLYFDPDATGIAPPFEVPDYADELIACQRYWQHVPVQNSYYVAAGGQGQSLSTLAVAMRTTPTWAIVNAGALTNCTFSLSVGGSSINPLLTATAAGMVGVFNRSVSLNARM